MSEPLMPQIRPPVTRTIHTLGAHLEGYAGVEPSATYVEGYKRTGNCILDCFYRTDKQLGACFVEDCGF